jgi:hypothetical protein
VYERHAEVPVELQFLILQYIFKAALGAVFCETQDHRDLYASTHEAHSILMGHITNLCTSTAEVKVIADILYCDVLGW